MSRIKEDKHKIGTAIQGIALQLVKSVRMKWKQLVFSVGRREVEGQTVFTDILFVMREGSSRFEDAFSRELRKELDRPALMDVSDFEKEIYAICMAAGDKWNQLTLCIDSDGQFNTFFGYPEVGKNPDPFDGENFAEWKSQFLAPEE